jgi:DNA polymerase elongation subunit (family B)
MSFRKFFPYYWCIDEKEVNLTCIRIYGLNKSNQNICLRIDNFYPYCYVDLNDLVKNDQTFDWSSDKINKVKSKIDELCGKDKKPLFQTFVMKHKLYGANLENDNKTRKQFPYLQCFFANTHDMIPLIYQKRGITIVGIGSNLKFRCHEQDASPILQLICSTNIKTASWFAFKGVEITNDNDKITHCHKEYKVKWQDIQPLNDNSVGKPLIMGFDLEVNSSIPSAMPKAENKLDKIFQISCVFSREGTMEFEPYLLTLGQADMKFFHDNNMSNVIVQEYTNEGDLLCGFKDLILLKNPNILVGYNILGFDIPYMIKRADFPTNCYDVFDMMGFHRYNHAKEKIIKWSSSAYKNQEFQFLDAEGRVFVDLLPLVKRDYKLNNYKLDTVAEYFLGDKKDDLSAKGIFKCYRIGTKKQPDNTYSDKSKKAISLCGKYCVNDSVLVVKLMEKLQIWVGLTEMASTCNTTIFSLYTQGQQIKVYSQVYKFCFDNGFVVEKDGYIAKEDERYTGAHVFPPIAGLYEKVIPFDFASLYPTTIIAYNIDFSTFVPENQLDAIPNRICNVMEWDDCVGCQHDPKVIRKNELNDIIEGYRTKLVKLRTERDEIKKNKIKKDEIIQAINDITEKMKPYIAERSDLTKKISKKPMCASRYYKFVKEPKGVIPTILQNLLDARKNTRKIMKENNKLIQNETDENKIKDIKLINNVLEKRQLAYKVSANSVAGPTPIPCLIHGKFVYKTIDDVSKGNWKHINNEQEVSDPIENLHVWSDNGFTKVKYVMRHFTEEPLYVVQTRNGLVKCTKDHSLLRSNNEEVSPCSLKIGDELLHHDLILDEIDIEALFNQYQDYILILKKHKQIEFNNELLSAKIFLLCKNIDMNVSINLIEYSDEIESSQMFLIKIIDNNDNNINVRSISLDHSEKNSYVYDLETENHHFASGIGSMIVHNSMYGAMGVKRGYLPFMPGAMVRKRKIKKFEVIIYYNFFIGNLLYG